MSDKISDVQKLEQKLEVLEQSLKIIEKLNDINNTLSDMRFELEFLKNEIRTLKSNSYPITYPYPSPCPITYLSNDTNNTDIKNE